MSQHMQQEGEPRGYQAVYTPPIEETTPYAQQRMAEAQKIGVRPMVSDSGSGVSGQQRLALAVVSVIFVSMSMSAFAFGNDGALLILVKLAALVMIAIAAIAINAIFNSSWRH